jgi:hypothetical protein
MATSQGIARIDGLYVPYSEVTAPGSEDEYETIFWGRGYETVAEAERILLHGGATEPQFAVGEDGEEHLTGYAETGPRGVPVSQETGRRI